MAFVVSKVINAKRYAESRYRIFATVNLAKMNHFSKTNYSGQFEGRKSNDFKAPFVWLEHARAVCLRESDDLIFQLGPLHAINWSPSLDFQNHVLELICHVSRVGQDDFIVSPALRYGCDRYLAKPGVGIFTNYRVTISNETLSEIEAALTAFCRRVLEGQEVVDQEQLFRVELSEKTDEIVKALADNFLSLFGGKKVGEPRLLKTKNCEMLVAGTYRSRESVPLPDLERWTAIGEVDGLRGMTRTVFIVTANRKTIVVYFDEESFKKPLCDRVLDGAMYEFVIETEWISPDKKIDSLVSIRPCDGGDLILR